jgi:ABC-2 type transport system permease protein
MLWYKAWLETRTRFLISLAGMTALGCYRVWELDRNPEPWYKLDYYYFALRSGHQLITLMWIVAATLLLMGGLLREKALGVSSFTLALPASRRRLMGVRIGTGFGQGLVLAIVPWSAMFVTAALTGQARSIFQAWFSIVLLIGGGAVIAGVALLVSALIEGEYTAPMVSFGFAILCGNAPKSLEFVNPLGLMGGRAYLGGSNMLVRPIPWIHVTANLCVTAILVGISVKIVERRDF